MWVYIEHVYEQEVSNHLLRLSPKISHHLCLFDGVVHLNTYNTTKLRDVSEIGNIK